MGLFDGMKAINKANGLVKQIEQMINEFHEEAHYSTSPHTLRILFNRITIVYNELIDTISSTSTSAHTHYYIKGQKMPAMALVAFLKDVLQEMDNKVKQLGA